MDLDYTEKMQGYIDSLEKEKSKILVFQRELPLCLELVSQAIESCKQQLSGTNATEYNVNGHSECSEQTTSTEEGTTPVLEQFIPMKTADDDDVDEDEEHEHDDEHEHHSYKQQQQQQQQQQINDTKKKSDWLRSAQLWNQTPDPLPKQDPQPGRKVVSVVEVKRNNGAFQPFHRSEKSSVPKSCSQSSDKSKNLPAPVAATSSTTAEPATGSGTREEKGQNSRKQRRCWSPELHRRFLQALQQLGGSHAATPKQIRELMKVDSLTNDEVKSHLQKFRLHTRRPSPTVQNNNPQPPQIVVVGGIWVPSQEYTAMATTDPTKPNSATGIYAPIPTTPQPPSVPRSSAPLKTSQIQPKSVESEGRSSHGTGGGARSHSPSASSSSHTTTASPMY